ncbi:GPCR fungal pheromone mating factor [Amylostereum chailletii]|nr:GPCR fungal pheromone mating factor [Amylostereum chailletii]
MDRTYPLVPVLNFAAVVVVMIPFLIAPRKLCRPHMVAFAAWVIVFSGSQGVGAIVWYNNADNVAPVWCNIVCHIVVGTDVGIPASTFLLTRQLYRIARMKDAGGQGAENPRRVSRFDLFLAFVFPVIVVAVFTSPYTSRR